MIQLAFTSLRIRCSLSVNRLISFCRRIPLLKRVVPVSLYGDDAAKKGIAVLALLGILLKRMLLKLLLVAFYVLVCVFIWFLASIGGIASLLTSEGVVLTPITVSGVLPYVYSFWFLTGFASSSILNVSLHDELMLNYFRANPKNYAISAILVARIVDLCLILPYFLILVMLTSGLSPAAIATMAIVHVSLRLFSETVPLFLYRTTGKFHNRFLTAAVAVLAFAVLFLSPHWFGTPNWPALLTNPLPALACVPVAAYALYYIRRYPCYTGFFRERIRLFHHSLEAIQEHQNKGGALNLESVKKWNQNLSMEDLKSNPYAGKEGFAYFNAIFFGRHKKFFHKNLLKRCVGILLVGLIVGAFGAFFLIKDQKPLVATLKEFVSADSHFAYAPISIFVIYLISMGRVVTASVFSNCDIQMLHYPYYRKKDTIFASFRERFAYILRYNLIICATLYLAAVTCVAILYGGMNYPHAGLFFLFLMGVGVFFAFNDLFLYYVIQPYDEKGQTKNIAYTIINIAIYYVSYANFSSYRYLNQNFPIYCSVTLGLVLLYLLLGTWALLVFAPKNFKIR